MEPVFGARLVGVALQRRREGNPAVGADIHGGEAVAVERESKPDRNVESDLIVAVQFGDRRSNARDVHPVEGRAARFVGIDPAVPEQIRPPEPRMPSRGSTSSLARSR